MTPTDLPDPAATVAVFPSGCEGISVLRVTGEIDLATVAMLVAGLDQVITRGRRAAIIDLTAMSFCSMRGFGALTAAAERAAATGVGFVTVGFSPRLSQLLSAAEPLSSRKAPLRPSPAPAVDQPEGRC